MGCQKDIAKTIRKGGGHYLLAVKENQPTLFKDICASFDDAVDTAPRPSDQAAPLPLASWQDTDAGQKSISESDERPKRAEPAKVRASYLLGLAAADDCAPMARPSVHRSGHV